MKTELWDKVQYIFRYYYDRMIHVCIKYDGKLDTDKLRKAICTIVNKVDILHSSCKDGIVRGPHWKVNEPMQEDEAINLVEVSDEDEGVKTALSQGLELGDKFQIKCTLVRSNGKDSLCFLINHMCCDGSDAIYLVKKIIEQYNCMDEGKEVEFKTGTRSATQLYEQMEAEFAKKAKKLNKNVSRGAVQRKFPFDTKEDGVRRIIINKLERDSFVKLKAKSKSLGYTINDCYLASFFYELATEMNHEQGDVNIISMIDNRRYMKNGTTLGITNMTGFMPCKLEYDGKKTFEETLVCVAQQTAKAKADPYTGLYGIPLLMLAFRIFPYYIAETAIRIGYANPLIGMSNIGILKEDDLNADGLGVRDAFAAGASKNKPYVQIATTTFKDEATFIFPQICTEEDAEKLEKFLGRFVNTLREFANKE